MTDRNMISQVIESLFEDWIDKNINVHPLAVENMRILEADAIAMLKEQEAVQPKWTSIKERYPEKEGFYLVSAEHGNYHPWIAEMRIFAGVKGFCNGAAMPVVGAWMPLPEPYTKVDKA